MKHELIEINVHGHVGAGKTAILAVIEKALKENFGVCVASPELEAERRMGNPDKPEKWESPDANKHIVVLTETNPKTVQKTKTR